MKQALNLNLSQQLSLTPQLQQSLKLLQMSTLDLQQEIQKILESNIMLELDENNFDHNFDKKTENTDLLQTSEGSQTDIPNELPIDSSWEDVYENALTVFEHTGTDESIELDSNYKLSTLGDYLLWQLGLAHCSERDMAIATALIDALNEDGYFRESIDDIFQGLQNQLDDLEFDEVMVMLHRIQSFDPVGVGARDLAECLRLQLQALPNDTSYKTEALIVLTQHIDILAEHNQEKLMRSLQLTESELSEVIALIRTLDPKPGAKIQETDYEYVIPDVYVKKYQDQWLVSLSPDATPKLRINPLYSSFIKRADNSTDNTTMKNHLQEAKWFIKSLTNRNDTLLRVARCIVEKQSAFLEHGSVAMRPMVLKDIADELGLHESTISRVTNQKYMHTPNGIVEFRYFFSSHVYTESGGECSSTAIRAFIKELISNEDAAKPLSDDKIATLLKEKGINVARRTIAKYREAMSIPPSNQRKRVL